jgi:hypothetical protein
MNDTDAILLAAFDDEAQLFSPPSTPGPRPPGRPRLGTTCPPRKEPIAIVLLDSDLSSESSPLPKAGCVRPTLAFDIGWFEPETTAFHVLYSTGTPLDSLKPRTVWIPVGENGSPINSLRLYARSPAQPDPVP